MCIFYIYIGYIYTHTLKYCIYMCVYKYQCTVQTVILCTQKLWFWMRLITINNLTTLNIYMCVCVCVCVCMCIFYIYFGYIYTHTLKYCIYMCVYKYQCTVQTVILCTQKLWFWMRIIMINQFDNTSNQYWFFTGVLPVFWIMHSIVGFLCFRVKRTFCW